MSGGESESTVEFIARRTFSKTFAVSLGITKISSIRKIWADDVLRYDSRYDARSKVGGFTLYDGTQTIVDPIIEMHQGAGNAPAYKGQSYVLFNSFPISVMDSKVSLGTPLPEAVAMPSFKFEVDAIGSTIHHYESTRESLGYSSAMTKVPHDNPIYEPLIRSPFRLTQINNDVTTWVDSQSMPTYAGIVTNMQDLATTYPASVITEVVGQSYGNLDIVCSRLFDDGLRPIFGISNGIHGDERDAAWAIESLVEKLINSTDPVYTYVRDNFSVFIVATVNPDGMADPTVSTHGGTGIRNNGNDVNLNRNWQYYWDETADTDKGAYAGSEPEVQAIEAWLITHGVKRIRCWVDTHGWNSRNEWGFLCEQIYHNYNVQHTQRACYNYAQALLRNRTYISGCTFNGAGSGRPKLVESRSRRKPYIYTWIQQQVGGNCFGCIIEYPQIESVGLVNTAMTDIYKGIMAGACDSIQGLLNPIAGENDSGGNAILAPYAPLNNNSLFQEWNDVEKRPSYFSANGLRLTKFAGIYRTREWIRMSRPDDVGWPVQVAGAGYALTPSMFYMAGGYNVVNELATLSGENLDDGTKTINDALPIALRDGRMSYYDSRLYFSGGFDLSGNAYSSIIYSISTTPDAVGHLVGWSLFATMPIGLQRHSQAVWGGYLVISGGRDSVGYKTDVRLFDVVNKTWSIIANLVTARGWHTSAVYGDYLYVFGGWTGGATLNTVERVNLITGAVSFVTALINSRAEQGIATNGSSAYLLCGRTGASTVQNDVWAYDMSTETITNIAYTLEQTSDTPDHDPAPAISSPYTRSPTAFFQPLDGYIAIIGGVDGAGLISDAFYQLDLGDNIMYRRKTDVPTWGYLRTTTTHIGIPGDEFSLNVAVRNTRLVELDRNPYVRLTVIIGPLSNPTRKIRSGYFVPPQIDFRTYTLPFILQAGETEFRCYLRHYGGGTSVDVMAFQLVPKLTTGFIVPQEGGSGGSLTEIFRTPINPRETMRNGLSAMARSASGTFSCIFGSQQNINKKIFAFTCSENSNLTLCEVWFEATEDYTNGVIINPAFPDLVAYPPAGRLYLKYQFAGGSVLTTDIFNVGEFELNHARLSREWRLDLIDWKLSTIGTDSFISFSYYGSYKQIALTPSFSFNYEFRAQWWFDDYGVWGDSFVFPTAFAGTASGIEDLLNQLNAFVNQQDPRIRLLGAHPSVFIKLYAYIGINVTGLTAATGGVIMSVSRSLSTVINTICESAGLTTSEYDASAVSGNLIGYANGQLTPARSLLDPLRSAFAIDVVESEGKLKFKSRANMSAPIVIDETELVPYDKAIIKIASRQEAEMPKHISVTYLDPDLTYQQNTQTASRDESYSLATDSAMSLPMVLDATTAMNIAEMLLSASWQGRFVFSFKTTFKYIHLEPSDLVTLNVNGLSHTVLITSKQINPSGFLEYSADQFSVSSYVQNSTATAGPVDNQTISLRKVTVWKELDLPIFSENDNDSGFYVVLTNDPLATGVWNGATYYKSVDNVFYDIAGGTVTAATTGLCVTVLGDAINDNIFDYKNTVDVDIFSGNFITKTEVEILNGGNAIAIGNEIVQFKTATLVTGDTYRLSGLLRGRLGTSPAGHVANEQAILLDGNGLMRYNAGFADIGRPNYYRAVAVGGDIETVSPVVFTNTARGLKPYSPCHLKGSRNSSGDVEISWVRRTRFNGQIRDYIDVPLNESYESYTLKIMSGAIVKRTVSTSTPNFTYTSAMQVIDFGSNQASVSIEVNQNSEAVGPGIAKIGVI